MDQWSARNWKLIQFVIHAKLVKLHHKMKTCKISPDDLVKGDEGGVESGEALVDGLEVGVADVNHRVVGVQSAELKMKQSDSNSISRSYQSLLAPRRSRRRSGSARGTRKPSGAWVGTSRATPLKKRIDEII